MIKNEKLDAVVCIVEDIKLMIAKEILKNKINLFTEKPMAPTLKQATHLVKLAKRIN